MLRGVGTSTPTERKRCLRINKAMTDFSEFIEDIELRDFEFKGGKYTWRKGDRQGIATRLDRFLISEELDNCFRNVKLTESYIRSLPYHATVW